MDNNTTDNLSLPTAFGKCLDLPKCDPRALNVCQIIDEPQLDSNADLFTTHVLENFELKGILKIDDRGFLYVDLDNKYIYDLFELLGNTNAELPPYFRNIDSFGAHITAGLINESFDRKNIPKLGEEISFTITGCYSIHPENWQGVSKVWFLTIDSSDLVSMRKELGLSAKVQDHEFHITFAIEKEFLSLDDFLFPGTKGIEIDKAKVMKRKVNLMKRVMDNKD